MKLYIFYVCEIFIFLEWIFKKLAPREGLWGDEGTF